MRSRSPTSDSSTTSRRRRWAATDAPFLTLAGHGEAEIRVRASRFLGHARPAQTEEAARDLLTELQRRYFDATHHCSAWRLRSGIWRANDAGEPGGSAGAPILGAIDAAGVIDVVVVVVRYFGGTKLGVGGLIRAYSEAAEAALGQARRREGVPAVHVLIRYPYPHTAAVMRALELAEASALQHGYSQEHAEAELTAIVPASGMNRLLERLREQTSGEVLPHSMEGATLYRPAFSTG